MKGRFKYSPNLTQGSVQSSCITQVKIVSQPKTTMVNRLLTLGIRLCHTALIVPFVVGGITYIPESAQAQLVNRASNGCPAGTKLGATNFIVNGNFATKAGVLPPVVGLRTVPANLGFTSDLPYRGDGVYPDDANGGGLSIQTGIADYRVPNLVFGQRFPGDPTNGAPPSDTYLYSNPNLKVDGTSALTPTGNPVVWRQTVTGLQPNTTYNFIAYFYNLLNNVPGVAPIIVLKIDSSTGSSISSVPVTVSTQQQWTPVQFAFTTEAGQTAATLSIIDQANRIDGDDFGLTAIAFNQCLPNGGGLILLKRITAATRGGAPISGVSFTDVLADTNDAIAISQAGLQPVGVNAIPATNPLQSGDVVQYTVYFLGQQALQNFNFCDLIPTGTTYVPNSVSTVGSGTGADRGRYFSPLTPVQQVAESSVCDSVNNPNGTLIVKLGNVPNGQPGSVSFRVKIN